MADNLTIKVPTWEELARETIMNLESVLEDASLALKRAHELLKLIEDERDGR